MTCIFWWGVTLLFTIVGLWGVIVLIMLGITVTLNRNKQPKDQDHKNAFRRAEKAIPVVLWSSIVCLGIATYLFFNVVIYSC